MSKWILGTLVLTLSSLSFCESADIKLKDVEAGKEDTSIVIKKGDQSTESADYELVSGSEDLAGRPEFDPGKAYSNWETACADWKKSVRENNAGSHIVALHCGKAEPSKESEKNIYRSKGEYKIKLKMREKKQK